MELTTEQAQAANAVWEFLASDRQTFTLHGVAGTGKTTVATMIAKELDRAKLCAYTGKAASVLRKKSGMTTSTVHGLFYRYIDKDIDPKTKRTILQFEKRIGPGGMTGEKVILDECSMIDQKMAKDLLQSGAKIIAVGDPAQLPPFSGASFFNKPDAVLIEVHRQALESAVLRQAHAVRLTGRYEADGDDFVVIDKAKAEHMLAADVILCWRNATRHRLNYKMRDLLECDLPYPMAGEQVVCLKNAAKFGIFNGCVYQLARNFEPDDRTIALLMDGAEFEVPNCRFVERGGSLDDYDDDDFISAFDYGYALTVHKAQGSEWDNVLLIDENHKHDRQRWLYTAITRAAKRILVQQ